MINFGTRTTLLAGLPLAPLNRDANDARTDLMNMFSGLASLGPLNSRGALRPLIVVAENALDIASAGGDAAATGGAVVTALEDIIRDLREYYGGDSQPQLPPLAQDEALVFPQRDTRLLFTFISGAVRTSRSVAQLTVPRFISGQKDGKAMYGTGWLIAPGLIITNHHVIDARDRRLPPWGSGEDYAAAADFQIQATEVVARFDYQSKEIGPYIDCEKARLVASDVKLDYALIELVEADKVADRAPLPVILRQPSLIRGTRLNIAQHPNGGPLQYAIRNNFYVGLGDSAEFLRYQTDTEPGASGSPVCDDAWQVVALHHSSNNVPAQMVPQEVVDGYPVRVTLLNEAIAIHAILKNLSADLQKRISIAQGWA